MAKISVEAIQGKELIDSFPFLFCLTIWTAPEWFRLNGFARMGTLSSRKDYRTMTVKEIERLIFITREIERMKTDIYYLSNEYEAFLYPFRAAFHHLVLSRHFRLRWFDFPWLLLVCLTSREKKLKGIRNSIEFLKQQIEIYNMEIFKMEEKEK